MKNAKRTISGIMAFAFMLTLASCGDNNNNNSNSESGQNSGVNSSAVTGEKIAEKSFKAIEIGGTAPMNYINNIDIIGDTGKVLVSGSTDDGNVMCITDYEFTDFNTIDFDLGADEKTESYYNAIIGNDGTIYIFATLTTYGDMELPDWEDPNFDSENFDWEAFNAAAESTYKLYTMDIDGNVLSENEITGLDKYESDDEENRIYLGDVYMCGDKLIMNISSGGMDDVTVSVGADGVIGDEIDLGDDMYNLYTNTTGKDGNLYFASYGEDGNVIKHIDAETMTVSSDSIAVSEDINYISNIMQGAGDYDFYISDSTSLFGVKADGTTDEVINWLDSDLSGDYIDFCVPVENGEFIIHERNWSTNTDSFYRLTKRDASELENVQIINMVVAYSDNEVMDKVKKFNQENDGYRIKVDDYNKYYEWDDEKGVQLNSPESQLKLDIAAGKTPDIICMNSNSSLFTSLGKKGALVDLYEFMGTDGTVSKDDILPNLLKAGEIDGKLATISPSFYITTFAAKKKFIDKQGWTADELIETYNNCPDGMSIFRYNQSKAEALNIFLYSGKFIDVANGTCSFDSPEFIKVLEFCNNIESDEIDWESMSNDEMNDYWQNQETAVKEERALLSDFTIYNMRDYNRERSVTFNNEEFSLVGVPDATGNGAMLVTNLSYAVMANSANKEICWKFISQFFDEEYQSSDRVYAIPALKTVFEKKLDDTMKKPYYIDDKGKKNEYEDTYYINDKEVKIPNLTQEERDFLEEYILGAEAQLVQFNNDVTNIITEETDAYFEGERSAQETAELIQNRVSILISEQA